MKTKIPELKKPKIILYNVDHLTLVTEITEAVGQQNGVEGGDTKGLFKMERKNGTHWVLALSPENFKPLNSKKKRFVGWQNMHVREYLSVPQCYKCGRFGHTTKYCTGKAICFFRRNHGHIKAHCNSQIKCINCHASNREFDTNYTT